MSALPVVPGFPAQAVCQSTSIMARPITIRYQPKTRKLWFWRKATKTRTTRIAGTVH